MSRNIVLLCLDSVRKDYFDEHASKTKRLSDLSFEQCRAASSWSVPSHASMITGRLPHQHGIHTHNRDFSTLARERTVFADIPDEYHTIGISANVYAGPAYNFDEFFDDFVDVPRYQFFADGLNAVEYMHTFDGGRLSAYVGYLAAALKDEKPAKSLVNGAMAQAKRFAMGKPIPDPMDDGARVASREAKRLADDSDGPFFLFMNLMEAHEPYSHIRGMDRSLHSAPYSWRHTSRDYWDVVTAPEEHTAHLRLLRQLYAANVDYLDRVVADLIVDIQRRTSHETTFVITADHGENLVLPHEDHLLGHKSSLSESVLHVPLEIVNPPDEHASETSKYVSHLRLPELMRNLANGTCPDVSADRVAAELVGLSGGPEPPTDQAYWDRMMRCVYADDRKVVWDSLGDCALYRLDAERPTWQETVDNDVDVPSWATEFFDGDITEYKDRVRGSEQQPAVDEATKDRLADLGYM